MTKRLRDGPVVLQSKRPCAGFSPAPPRLKRKRDHVEEYVKRFRSAPPGETTCVGVKRRAECFDQELHRLEKRMRASVPTAEEAIAFLLPHIMQLRGLYNAEKTRASELAAKNVVLRRACLHLLQEKQKLESELEVSQYRLTLNGPKPYDAWCTE